MYISIKFKKLILSPKVVLLVSLCLITANILAQKPRKERVDTFGIALRMEHKKHLHPTVDSLTTKELSVFILSPQVKPNASLRLIERNTKTYIEARILYKNISNETISAFKNHNYKQLKLKLDSFNVEISDSFKVKMLDAYRQTVNQKFIDLFPKKILLYHGTNLNFWINEDGTMKSKNIREDMDAIYYGWQFAKINLQIIDDLKNGAFDETKYDIK